MADKAPELVEVELLVDVWDENGVRLETNIKEYDERGLVKIDPKSLAPITTTRIYPLDIDFAERLVNEGKARVPLRRKG